MGYDENGLFSLIENELVDAFSTAFTKVRERDWVLFEEAKPQERAFMHRFAQELRKCFADAEDYRSNRNSKPIISLDVEYNRDGSKLKLEDPENPETHKWIAPDIILHERLSGSLNGEAKNRNNIFACEMKLAGLSDGNDAKRVKDFLEKRRYKYGVDFFRFATTSATFDLYKCGDDKKVTYCYDEVSKRFTTKG